MTDLIFLLTILTVTLTVLWRGAEARARRAEQQRDELERRFEAREVPEYAIQGETHRATLRMVKGGRS